MPSLARQLRRLRCYAVLTYPFACVPFLFLYFRAYGLDVQGYGLIIAAYYLAMFIAEVPTGMLADRYGPRALLIVGPLLLAAGFGTLAAWPTGSGFLLGEVLLGLGHATLSGPPATILWQTLHEHGQGHRYLQEEGRIHGLRLCGTGTAFLLGGVLAEALADADGFAWRPTIALTCVLNLAAAAIAARLHREPGRPMPRLREFAQAVRDDLTRPAVRWLLGYWIVLFALLRYPFHNYQPYLDEAAAREPAFARPLVIGTVFALLNAIAAPLSWAVPRLVAGVGRRTLFWAMPLLLCGSMLVMAWERQQDGGAGSRALAWLGVSMFVLQQVPFGMHWALLQEFVNHRIATTARTTVMSVLSLGARLCYAGINVGLFALQQRHGMAAALLVAGGGGALATTLVLWTRPRGLLRGDGPLA